MHKFPSAAKSRQNAVGLIKERPGELSEQQRASMQDKV